MAKVKPLLVSGYSCSSWLARTLIAARAGTIPPTGVATYPLAIPNDPSQIGRTMYFQGMTMAPRSLTSDWVQLTILP
jgi:hypothetical protein